MCSDWVAGGGEEGAVNERGHIKRVPWMIAMIAMDVDQFL
jgi:hypothetical protein